MARATSFFPVARLTVKQDGGIRWRNDADLFQYLLNGWALADYAFEAVLTHF